MLKMKKNARILMTIVMSMWSVVGFSEVFYSIYFILTCPTNAKTLVHAVVIFNFIFIIVFLIGMRRLLFHFVKSVEKKDVDLFIAHTLFGDYEFHKKDVFINKLGRVKIDLYNCYISINKSDYIDCTPAKNFWNNF